MKTIKTSFDKVGNTLNVWFDDPKTEHLSEETADEIILVKNKKGKVIGLEVLNCQRRWCESGASPGIDDGMNELKLFRQRLLFRFVFRVLHQEPMQVFDLGHFSSLSWLQLSI